MEKNYRLEFNQEQQHFRLDNYTHEEYTNGWITVFEFCTDLEFKFLKSYIEVHAKGKLTENDVLGLSNQARALMVNLTRKSLTFN